MASAQLLLRTLQLAYCFIGPVWFKTWQAALSPGSAANRQGSEIGCLGSMPAPGSSAQELTKQAHRVLYFGPIDCGAISLLIQIEGYQTIAAQCFVVLVCNHKIFC
jgi:hypothetical protein